MSDTYSQSRPNGLPRETNDTARGLGQQARAAADELKGKASGLKDTVQSTISEHAESLKNAASDAASEARETVEKAAMHQKSLGADYIGSIAGAMSRAANEFENDLPQAAHYIRQASEQVSGLADTVRQRDMRELAAEVQDFARKQPTLFFGGAVILGFAALRFFKSAAPSSGSGNAFMQRRAEEEA